MIKKKVILIISVLVVLGGALATVGIFKNYSDNQTRSYIQNSIKKINTDMQDNNLASASTELKSLTTRSKGLNDKELNDKVTDLTTALIKQQNEVQIQADLKNLSNLIEKGSLSEAAFEAQKIAGEPLSPADIKELKKQESKLDNANDDEKTATVESNAMSTLSDLIDEGRYTNANKFLENLDTSGFSDTNLSKIQGYSKQIQQYQNQFKLDDYDIPSSQLKGLYKEAFPTSKDSISISSTVPVYFISNTPVYQVSVSSSPSTIYLSADGKNVTKTQFTTELNNKNLYTIENGKKVLADSIPSDSQ